MSEADMEKIHAEAHASVVMETLASDSFAAGPMIRELRDLIRVLPDRAGLHACLGFCLKRIEEFDEARASLSKAESLLQAHGHLEIADRLRSFSERLKPKV
jgi:Flp pilus assembly protein TadD